MKLLQRASFLHMLCAAAFGLTFWALPPLDPDLGWHLIGGSWIAQHHSVPRSDFINAFRQSWLDYHWLGQVVMAQLFDRGGFALLMLTLGLLMATLFVCLIAIAHSSLSSQLAKDEQSALSAASHHSSATHVSLSSPVRWSALVSGTVGLTAIQAVTSHRPQMCALLLLATALLLMVRAPRWWHLPASLGITLIAVSIHVYWIFIPFLWCAYRFLPALSTRWLAKGETERAPLQNTVAYSALGFIALLLVPIASPYGLMSNYELLYEYVSIQPTLASTLLEFRSSLSDPGPPRWILLGSFALVMFALGRGAAPRTMGDPIVFAVGSLLAVSKVKFLGVFGVFAIPYVATVSFSLLNQFSAYLNCDEQPNSAPFATRIHTVLLAIGIGYFLLDAARNTPLTSDFSDALRTMYPIEACQRVGLKEKQGTGHAERILTSFDHGGWCAWAIHSANPDTQLSVTADGRTQNIPDSFYQALFDLFALRGGWISTLRQWDPEYAVVRKDTALAQFMALANTAWHLEFQDEEFAFFRQVRDAQ